MRLDDLFEHVGQTVSVPDSFYPAFTKRLVNEGPAAISRMCAQTYKTLLAQMLNIGAIAETHTPFGVVPALSGRAACRVLDLFGLYIKLNVEGQSPPADYEGFKSRSQETNNFSGADWDSIVPMNRLDRRYIAKMMGSPPASVRCKHGPGATAEKLRGWDKYLSVDYSPHNPIRMVDVPKDALKRRLIGIEPCASQFMQQGLARALRRTNMFRAHVCLQDQMKHVKFASVSLASSDFRATLDLSDASDRIPPSLVEYLLPDWYQTLAFFTSSSAQLPSGERIPLGMMATMGNGFCFELETLIFLLVAGLVVSKDRGIPLSAGLRLVKVYGDDIILPDSQQLAFRETAYRMGWVISEGKSSRTPHFLETCGYYIDAVGARKRLAPSLQCTKDGELNLTYHQARELSRSLSDLWFDEAADALLLEYGRRDSAVRWNKDLQRSEIKLNIAVDETRPLSVTESTRYRAYWESGLKDQRIEATGRSRFERRWETLS